MGEKNSREAALKFSINPREFRDSRNSSLISYEDIRHLSVLMEPLGEKHLFREFLNKNVSKFRNKIRFFGLK